MNARQERLRRRREVLIARVMMQRDEIAVVTAQLQQRMRIVDLGFAVGRALRRHPLLAMTGTSLLLRAPSGKLMGWVSRAYTGWELFSVVRRQWAQHSTRE